MAGSGMTAQINVRMDPEEKARGDAALASIGLTPSEAIRALWAQAARGQDGLLKAKRMLGITAAAEGEGSRDDTPSAVQNAMVMYDDAMAKVARQVGHPVVFATTEDEPTLDELREEYFSERGWL